MGNEHAAHLFLDRPFHHRFLHAQPRADQLGVRRHSRSANNYTTGGGHFPAFLIGFLVLSEFIGTAVSIGTAQTGFKTGISAAWNLFALALGFVLFAWLLARKYKELGDNTISGVLARNYGQKTRFATSIITIFALEIVAVSIYASGGAVLASVLQVDRTLAIIIVGVVSVMYVSIGGMRSVIYTNFVHASLKYLGVGLALWFGLKQVGGISALQTQLPPSMFDWTAIGWGQIIAWMIAGIGSIFSTQYVIQAVTTVSDAGKAQRACFYCAILMIPFGIGAALIGMCSAALFPQVDSLQAFPRLIASMDQLTAGLVVAGLAGSLFGTISAVSMGSATLLLRDFYEPWFNPEKSDAKSLRFVRHHRRRPATDRACSDLRQSADDRLPRQSPARLPGGAGADGVLRPEIRHRDRRVPEHYRLPGGDRRLVPGRQSVGHRQCLHRPFHAAGDHEHQPRYATRYTARTG